MSYLVLPHSKFRSRVRLRGSKTRDWLRSDTGLLNSSGRNDDSRLRAFERQNEAGEGRWLGIAATIAEELFCSWRSRPGTSTSRCVLDRGKFFRALGQRVKKLRERQGYSQEDMIAFGFSPRHWQEIEAGRPITMTTLLRICDAFRVHIALLVRGADDE